MKIFFFLLPLLCSPFLLFFFLWWNLVLRSLGLPSPNRNHHSNSVHFNNLFTHFTNPPNPKCPELHFSPPLCLSLYDSQIPELAQTHTPRQPQSSITPQESHHLRAHSRSFHICLRVKFLTNYFIRPTIWF